MSLNILEAEECCVDPKVKWSTGRREAGVTNVLRATGMNELPKDVKLERQKWNSKDWTQGDPLAKRAGPTPEKMALQRWGSPRCGQLGKWQEAASGENSKVEWGNPCQRCHLRAERLFSTGRRWEPAWGTGRGQGESYCRERSVWSKSGKTQGVEGAGRWIPILEDLGCEGIFQHCMKGVSQEIKGLLGSGQSL